MKDNSGGLSCAATCWGIALLGGILVAALLIALADYAFIAAVFFGLLAFVIGGLILTWAFCRSLPGPNEATVTPASTSSSATATTKPASAASAASTSAAAATPAGVMASGAAANDDAPSKAPKAKPAAKKSAAKSTASKSTATKSASAKKPAAKKTAAKSTAEPKAAAKTTAAKSTASKSTAAKRKPVAKDGKPETLKKPRAGGADDLKMIKGVGPGLEKTLNELGFWHYEQIAGWRKKEVEWVDERLKFKGRIERDDWIKQAKTLAKGGSTEFSKRAKY